MFLEEVMPAYRRGAKIRRMAWREGHHVYANFEKGVFCAMFEDNAQNHERLRRVAGGMHADDWEIFEEAPRQRIRAKT